MREALTERTIAVRALRKIARETPSCETAKDALRLIRAYRELSSISGHP